MFIAVKAWLLSALGRVTAFVALSCLCFTCMASSQLINLMTIRPPMRRTASSTTAVYRTQAHSSTERLAAACAQIGKLQELMQHSHNDLQCSKMLL